MVNAQAAVASGLLFTSFLLFCVGAGLPQWRVVNVASNVETLNGQAYPSFTIDNEDYQKLALKYDCTIGFGLFQYNGLAGKCGKKEAEEILTSINELTQGEVKQRLSYFDSYPTSSALNCGPQWKQRASPGQPIEAPTAQQCAENGLTLTCTRAFQNNNCQFYGDGNDIDRAKLYQQIECVEEDPLGRFCVELTCPDLRFKKAYKLGKSKSERSMVQNTCGRLRMMQAFAVLAVLFSFLAFAVSTGAASGALTNFHAPAVLALLACLSGATVFGTFDQSKLSNLDNLVQSTARTFETLWGFVQTVDSPSYGSAFGAEVAGFVTSAIAFILLMAGAADPAITAK